MSIIDDDGRLFGVVNLIDLLVGLLVLAILVAGAVFLMAPAPDVGERYVTLDLGPQPDHVINAIERGDLVTYDGLSDNLTITDTYVYQNDGEAAIMVRALASGSVEFDESRDREVFSFLGDPLRPGRTLDVSTPEYAVAGEVIGIGSEETFNTDRTEVVLRTMVDPATAETVTVGDTFGVGVHTVGEVIAIQAYPGNATTNLAYLGLSLNTVEVNDRLRFGHQRLTLGSTIDIQTESYSLSGEIVQRGDAAIETESTELLLEAAVPTDVADSIEAGDSVIFAGSTLMTIDAVTQYATGNPATKRVFMGVTAELRIVDDNPFFGDRHVRVGTPLPIVTDEYDFEADVVRRGTMALVGEPATVTVEAELLNVPPSLADRLEPGLVEQTGDARSAELLNVESEAAKVVIESVDGDIHLREHPINRDLELTLELNVRTTADGQVYFRGEPLRMGETVTLELGGVTPIEVAVVEIG